MSYFASPSTNGTIDHSLSISRLASDIKTRWRNGEPPDARVALTGHPELQTHKSIVLDLAYEEYCQRIENGQQVDVGEFCERFPDARISLCRRLEVHHFFEQNPDIILSSDTVDWPAAGDQFLRFRLIEELGHGAIGRVYLAEELDLANRLVVVKISAHGDCEAQTLGRLKHPHVVPIYSVEREPDTGLVGICMPYFSRWTLNDLLDAASTEGMRRRAFAEVLHKLQSDYPTSELTDDAAAGSSGRSRLSFTDGIIQLAMRLAEALDHAHRKNIYHLDIKPSNVLLLTNGAPMLLDFNLSVDQSGVGSSVGGTLPYMSPEQLRSTVLKENIWEEQIDGRSDIYSLGVLLHELLTGHHPFGHIKWRQDSERAAHQLLEAQENRLSARFTLPRTLDRRIIELIDRCLSISSLDRPQTGAECAAALRNSLSPAARIHRWVKNHRRLTMAGGVLLLAGCLTAGYAVATHQPVHVALYEEALTLYENGDYSSALDHAQRATLTQPNAVDAWILRGHANFMLAEYDLAFDAYRQSLRRRPDGEVYALAGYTKAYQGEHLIAIDYYKKAIAYGPESPEVLNAIGFSSSRASDYMNAQDYFDRSLELNPRLQSALYNRAFNSMKWAMAKQRPVPREVVDDARQAIALGPITPELMHGAACMLDLCQEPIPNRDALILDYLEDAVQLGFEAGQLNQGPCFSSLRGNPRFEKILTSSAGDLATALPSIPVRLPHPLEKAGASPRILASSK